MMPLRISLQESIRAQLLRVLAHEQTKFAGLIFILAPVA
jgi:hypothetical protein